MAPSDVASSLGVVVARLRRGWGKTQAAVAAELGISQPWYSKLERGQGSMSVVQLVALAECLGTTPASLMQRAHQRAAVIEQARECRRALGDDA